MEAYTTKFRLKDLYKFRGYKVYESWLTTEGIVVELQRTRKTGICPQCKKRCRSITDRFRRRVRDLDLCGAMGSLEFVQLNIACLCGYRGREQLDFIDKYSRYTRRFEEKVVILCQVMTVKDVAEEMRINWHATKEIDKKHAQNYIIDVKHHTPTKIGVDEIAYQKHHKYLTIVRDAEINKVIWVGKDRRQETLDQFFNDLGFEKWANIEVVACDMWDPYLASIKTHLPLAKIVFDKFHIAKMVNEALDAVRRQEFAKADEKERKDMKHKRFLLLSRQKRLTEGQRETLTALKKNNQTLYTAYLLKEQILDIFDESIAAVAASRLKRWMKNVCRAGIAQFEKLVKTLKSHLDGILNYFHYRLTNAPSEGLNNKIGVIQRRAYGFRDLDYFIYKIYQLCGINSP